MAASGQLEQVVHNLITNAARASAKSGGEVVVRVGPGSPGMACLEVIDHGVGIPEKDFDRIFEPFYTTRRAEKDAEQDWGSRSPAPSSSRTVEPSR